MSLSGRSLTLLSSSLFSGVVYILLFGCSVAYAVYYSLDWPLMHDGAVMHYIAWRILEGSAPYRDIFEADMPGSFLLHMLCLSVFGHGDLAFRLFDLFFCLLTAGAIIAIGWRQSKYYSFAGALFYIAFHLSWGATSMAERDFLMVPFILCATYALRAFFENPEKSGFMLLFGFLVGCAFWIKPFILFFVLLATLAVLFQPCLWKQKIIALVQAGAGILIPAVLVHIWLYWLGALPAFYDILFNFTLSTYPYLQKFSWHYTLLFLMFSIYSFSILTFLMYTRSSASFTDKTILLIGLLYGYLHFYAQGKGSWYHLYPLAAFMILYFTLILPRLNCKRWEMGIVHSITIIICIHFSPLQALSKENLDEYKKTFSLAQTEATANEVDDALRVVPLSIREPYLSGHPHQAVQFFSTLSFLWNVAYRQGWIVPSRQIMPFSLYCVFHSPYLDALAVDLFHDLTTMKPLVIIISSESWPYREALVYHTIDTQPPWPEFFAENYHLTKEAEKYRVYARIK